MEEVRDPQHYVKTTITVHSVTPKFKLSKQSLPALKSRANIVFHGWLINPREKRNKGHLNSPFTSRQSQTESTLNETMMSTCQYGVIEKNTDHKRTEELKSTAGKCEWGRGLLKQEMLYCPPPISQLLRENTMTYPHVNMKSSGHDPWNHKKLFLWETSHSKTKPLQGWPRAVKCNCNFAMATIVTYIYRTMADETNSG